MQIIPSIYLRDNTAVRIATGGTLYNADPVEMAKELASVGAEYLYIVDFNVPPAGHVPHLPIIEAISKETHLKLYIMGATRSADVVERYLGAGVERVILGTIAYQKPNFLKETCTKFPQKIGVNIDVVGGKVVIRGWTVAANKTPLDYAEQFKEAGVSVIIYSDVDREGELKPSDIKRVREFIHKSPTPVIHGTDISSPKEIEMLLTLESPLLIGTIIGRSMYSGAVDIASTITHVKESMPSGMDEPTLIP